MDVPTILWILIPAAVLTYAAVSDVRTREVRDWCWLSISVSGVVLSSMHLMDGGEVRSVVSMAVGSLLLTSFMLLERLSGIQGAVTVIAALAFFAAAWYLDPDGVVGHAAIQVPVMYLVFLGMYCSGILGGGADAKCLMSLAIAFPVYPVSQSLPVIWQPMYPEALVLNPVLSVMVLAMIISLSWGLRTLAMNISEGRFFRRMVTVYRMEITDARQAYVWPAERIEGGRKIPCRHVPFLDIQEAYDDLESAGETHVDVTSMIPFMLPVAVAYVLVTAVGNPVFAII